MPSLSARLARLSAHARTERDTDALLQEVVRFTCEATESPAGCVAEKPARVRAATGEIPPDLLPLLVARAETSRLPVEVPLEAGGTALAVAITGIHGFWGALVVLRASGPFTGEQQLHALSAASLAGGLIARVQAQDALSETEARSRAILETTVDAIITIDEAGTITSFNRAAERIFGYDAREVMGQNVRVLMPEPYHSDHDAYIERYLETGIPKIIGIGREVTGQRRDGTVFPMDLSVSEVLLREGRIFTGIVRDITDRRRLEQEVLRAGDLERRRIGQDLHDGLGQMLTGIGLIAGGLARRLANEAAPEADEVGEIASLVREADQYARGLARGLVPVELEMGGLVGALERLAESALRLFGIECRFERTGDLLVEDPTVAGHLYRIAQEAVSNAVRHGKAQHVAITLALGAEQVRLRIRDDGHGFNPEDASPLAADSRRGMGLRIMHYRARIIGASLDLHSTPGEGTTITCTILRGGETPARSLEEQLRDLSTA